MAADWYWYRRRYYPKQQNTSPTSRSATSTSRKRTRRSNRGSTLSRSSSWLGSPNLPAPRYPNNSNSSSRGIQ